MTDSKSKDKKKVPFLLALLPIVLVGVLLLTTVLLFDAEPHPILIAGTLLIALIAWRHGYSWSEIEESLANNIRKGATAMLILLIIGMLIGSWIGSGVVPAIMYYGFHLFSATWFLPSILILCSIVSVVTGSSWTTAGTIGVASIGIGQALGIPETMIAGAVVSGAFFGDKLSPLSDSTNLTPCLLKVDLYDHIRHMLRTTLPSFVIALILYAIIGYRITENGANGLDISEYQQAITSQFDLSWLLFIPPAAILTMVILKVPAIPSLLIGTLLGSVMQVAVQGGSMESIMKTIYAGPDIDTGWSEMDELLSRGGMSSMYSVVALAITALPFGGLMHDTGVLEALIRKMEKLLQSRGPLVATTVMTSILINIFGANQYLSVVLPGQMYEDNYQELNLHNKNLSRALEAGGTLTSPLVPWNSSGAFMMSVLGVNALAYAPFAFISLLTPLVTILYGFANISMPKKEETD